MKIDQNEKKKSLKSFEILYNCAYNLATVKVSVVYDSWPDNPTDFAAFSPFI